jgi:CRISPR-associated protein Cas1
MVKDATSLNQVRGLEARGAGLYHGDLEGIQLKWKDRDKKLVSPHWLVVGPRLSPLSDKPRRAVDPTNAIRNLSFSLLAAQCRLAAAVAGLDVHCAFLHSDHETRDSLVYDLMEPYRPVLDRWVLNFVTTNKFTYGDFVQTHEGQCRLHPDLAKYVAANSQIKVDIKPVLQVLMDNLPHTSTKEEPRPVPDVDQVQSPGKTDPLLEMVQKSLQLKGIHKHLRPH